MSGGPPVHYCEYCDYYPCVCERRSDMYDFDDDDETNNPVVSLDDYIEDKLAEVERFRSWYIAAMSNPRNIDPEGELMFPSHMPLGEWDEQLRAFEE